MIADIFYTALGIYVIVTIFGLAVWLILMALALVNYDGLPTDREVISTIASGWRFVFWPLILLRMPLLMWGKYQRYRRDMRA